MRRLLFALVLLVLAAGPASAQQIIPDLPGVRIAPEPARGVQLEAAFPQLTFTDIGPADINIYQFPVAVRIGVGRGFELNVSTSVFDIVTVDTPAGDDSDSEVGFDIIRVGGKAVLLGAGTGVAVTFAPAVLIPTENGDPVADFRMVFGVPVSPTARVVAAGGLLTDFEDAEALFTGALEADISRSVAAFAELSVETTAGDPAAAVGAGLSYRATPSAQLFLAVNAGLTDEAVDALVELGAAFGF